MAAIRGLEAARHARVRDLLYRLICAQVLAME